MALFSINRSSPEGDDPAKVHPVVGALIVIFFSVIWMGVTGAFDVLTGTSFYRQVVAQDFPSTTATITHSSIETGYGDDGTVFGVNLAYNYEVNGHPFEGHRYRYNEGSSSDSAWAREVVDQHPVGSSVRVFYNPNQPSDVLLSPGVNGSDVFWILFLTPFNIIMLALWIAGGTWLYRKFHSPAVDGFNRRRDEPTELPAFGTGLAATALVSFLCTFALAVPYGFHPPLDVTCIALGFSYLAGITAGFWQAVQNHARC